jgi:predicted nucleotidyltransferase
MTASPPRNISHAAIPIARYDAIVVTERAILRLVDDIVRQFEPERIILFGSYAWGAPTDDSDIDLLIVKRYTGASYLAASRIGIAADVDFPMDLIVRSPAEIRRRLAIRDFFIMEIIEQGLVLHDTNNRRVGEQGRRRLRRRLHSAKIAKAEPV